MSDQHRRRCRMARARSRPVGSMPPPSTPTPPGRLGRSTLSASTQALPLWGNLACPAGMGATRQYTCDDCKSCEPAGPMSHHALCNWPWQTIRRTPFALDADTCMLNMQTGKAWRQLDTGSCCFVFSACYKVLHHRPECVLVCMCMLFYVMRLLSLS